MGQLVAIASLAALLALQHPALCRAADEQPAGDRSDLNAKFLAPDLDVEHWVGVFEGESREVFQNRRQILDALVLEPGMQVADVGAGTGFFSELFAREVGSEGRVYALEISPRFLEHLSERVQKTGLRQIEVKESGNRSTNLPDASLDLAFICDVYHHFEHPDAMLASLYRALRPGGALVVIDFERIPGESEDWILEHMRADKDTFRKEILAAGFTSAEEITVEGLRDNYVLRFRRPTGGGG